MKEESIRPERIFKKHLSLAKKDTELYFKDVPFSYSPCPSCKSVKSSFAFRKQGFDYEECDVCGTLFANPRPSADAFSRYYSYAPSVKYWATHFYKITEDDRREKLIRPRAAAVKMLIDRYYGPLPKGACIADAGAGYGIFCEELRKLCPHVPIIAIEPSPPLLKICKDKGIETIPKFLENVTEVDFKDKKVAVIVSFELLEHLHSPDDFIRKCNELLDSGGLLILTTLNWLGFDLQILREHSNSIHPPHHINFFTTESIKTPLQRHGFEVCEVSTPGVLDVDIARKQRNDIESTFIKNLLRCDDNTLQQFQRFLQQAGLSSHMRITARKDRS
jgi:2-polyprenyl-3-methyl-5-hydroxy-6-metoxy-1,4-benzoquinol methylase